MVGPRLKPELDVGRPVAPQAHRFWACGFFNAPDSIAQLSWLCSNQKIGTWASVAAADPHECFLFQCHAPRIVGAGLVRVWVACSFTRWVCCKHWVFASTERPDHQLLGDRVQRWIRSKPRRWWLCYGGGIEAWLVHLSIVLIAFCVLRIHHRFILENRSMGICSQCASWTSANPWLVPFTAIVWLLRARLGDLLPEGT